MKAENSTLSSKKLELKKKLVEHDKTNEELEKELVLTSKNIGKQPIEMDNNKIEEV